MIFESNQKIADPYKDSIRIAYTAEDTQKAQELQKEQEEIMKQYTSIRPYNAMGYAMRMMCQSAISRYFMTVTEMKWNPKFGEIDFFSEHQSIRMSVRSRVVYGRLDNGWVEIIDEPIKSDGFLFSCFNRHVGIVFLLGFLTKTEFQNIINEYRDGVDNGVTYIAKGEKLSKGLPATRPFWRIPYALVNKFENPDHFGDFEQAKVDIVESYEQYPIPPRPNETKSN